MLRFIDIILQRNGNRTTDVDSINQKIRIQRFGDQRRLIILVAVDFVSVRIADSCHRWTIRSGKSPSYEWNVSLQTILLHPLMIDSRAGAKSAHLYNFYQFISIYINLYQLRTDAFVRRALRDPHPRKSFSRTRSDYFRFYAATSEFRSRYVSGHSLRELNRPARAELRRRVGRVASIGASARRDVPSRARPRGLQAGCSEQRGLCISMRGN